MENIVAQAEGKKKTMIFPIRFMRAFSSEDYAPLYAKLLPNGMVHVQYPAAV